jgi:hypothetical protein
MRVTVVILFIILWFQAAFSQTAYQHVSDRDIYQFINELASDHLIDVGTVVKPFSRNRIKSLLFTAYKQRNLLTISQQARLDMFMQEYYLESEELKTGLITVFEMDTLLSAHLLPPEIAYRDGFFRILIRPVYGYRNFSGGNDNFWVTYGGAEAISYIGNNWSVYASLRDNYQKGQKLSQPSYLTQEPGGTYKGLTGGGKGGEFSEMRGGITYSWDWGSVGFIKDHLEWGDNQNGSNILSGRTPSFPMIKLYINPAKWLEFNYFHGWLVSEAIDSVRSFFPESYFPRTVQRRKYIAANMFTVKPFERLHFSFGNSIVYGDMEVQPAYLIPFFFYKSLVHTIHWGSSFQNNALFMNLSSRQIKHLHLYATYFVDEFSIRRVTDPGRNNLTSFKGGFSLTDWPVRNLVFWGEYTRSNPLAFLHDEPTTTYESNRYNLGHYLQDNAEEFYGAVRVYPWRTLQFSASYTYARKGNYYEYIRGVRDPRLDELPVLDETIWDKRSLSFEVLMYPVSNFRIFTRLSFNDIQGYDIDERTGQLYLNIFTAPYLHGKTQILEFGFGLGI